MQKSDAIAAFFKTSQDKQRRHQTYYTIILNINGFYIQ